MFGKGPVRPEDRLESPDYDLDSSLRKTLIIKAGNTINVEIPVKGRPTPNITWTKGDINVTLNPRIQVENAAGKSNLIIQDCNRDDSGKYVLTLENASGVAKTFVSIRVLGKNTGLLWL